MKRTVLQAVLRRVEVASANGPRPLGDAELLRRFAKERDEAAFAVLVGRHGPLVWAVCRNLLANEMDAEDAFQATFLALVQSAGRIRTAAVGAWLHGVAVRVAKMSQRAAARRRRRERQAAAKEVGTPVANGTWDQLRAAVHEEVGQLPAALRTALVQCDLQGRSQSEVAAELGWKLGTLSGRLSKARRQLLERLSKRGVAAGSVVAAVVAGGAEGIASAPPMLEAKVAVLARAGLDLGSVASPALLELARGATELSMTRMKLFGLAALVTGFLLVGFGSTVLPLGNAQDKVPAPKPPVPGGTASGGGGGSLYPATPPVPESTRATPAWEYKYVVRKSSRLDDFQNALTSHATSGWEYVGTETLQVADGGSGPVLVFKRPVRIMGAGAGMYGISGPASGSGLGGMMGPAPGKTPAPRGANDPFSGKAPAMGMGPAPAANTPAPARREIQIIALKHASASSIAKTLQELFSDANTRIVAEQQSNSLLVQADRQTVEALVALLVKLDVPPARPVP